MTFRKILFFGLPIVMCAYAFSACQSTSKSAQPNANWAAGMQRLSNDVRILAPYIFSEKGFQDPSNQKLIRETLKDLAEAASLLSTKSEMGQADRDPSLVVALEELQQQLKDANLSFLEGNRTYAQHTAKLALNQCFHCHTRNQYGPALPQHNWADPSLANLSPLERASLAVALRDYDEATKTLEAYLVSTTKVDNFFHLDQALKTYLSVSVRVKQSPETALATIRKVRAKEGLPFYLKQDLVDWEKSLAAWENERKKTKQTGGLTEARGLIKRGLSNKGVPLGGSAYVHLLRATAILHNYMQTNPKKAEIPEASLLLGESYEYMNDLGSNYLSEYYYEACVNGRPKSDLARDCYSRLEKLIYFGFTGSSGVHVPKSVRQRLDRLKAVAF